MINKITSFFQTSFFTAENNIYYILIIVGILTLLFVIISLLINRKKNKRIKKVLETIENERKKAEDAKQKLEESTELIRSQAALSEILRNVTGQERSLEQFLQDALGKILSLSWLNVLSKGSIFMVNKDGNLEMIAEKGLKEIAVRCKLIKPGECLCGRALSEKKMQYCNHIGSKHEISVKNMQEHGHYNFPLIMHDEVLGVLNIYTEHKHQKTDFEVEFLQTVSDTLASVINRKKTQAEILKAKNMLDLQMKELEEKNKAIRKYSVQLEQQANERENLNQMILAQKKTVEEKKKEAEDYAKQIEDHSKNQEKISQKLFAQNLEVEQRNFETQQYAKELEKKAKEQEALNQKLFAQKLEVEQRNLEAEQYAKQIEKQNKEQEALNQKLFAQKLEVEQRNFEAEQYAKQIEKQKIEQDKLNQKLFAQSLEVDQRRIEIERYSKEIETLKEISENSLKHLNDSINYSKYIQDTLLPSRESMQKEIPGEFFVYYKPKEIIGGDFFYMNKINDYLLLGVADCTGHGVPGALITMLGITFLDDIIDRNLGHDTGAILDILRGRIKKTFKSYGKNIQNKNGLDVALCAINLKTNVMQFSGAFNPLFIIRNEELIEYKATRNPIGYYPVEKDFETTEIKLQKNDVIYLFSDGYPDQLGGEKERKFSKRQFKDLLFEIHKYPMLKQRIFVEKIMQKWMDNQPQVDDITLMGVKWEHQIITPDEEIIIN